LLDYLSEILKPFYVDSKININGAVAAMVLCVCLVLSTIRLLLDSYWLMAVQTAVATGIVFWSYQDLLQTRHNTLLTSAVFGMVIASVFHFLSAIFNDNFKAYSMAYTAAWGSLLVFLLVDVLVSLGTAHEDQYNLANSLHGITTIGAGAMIVALFMLAAAEYPLFRKQ
jgi:hypothetical protein